MKHTHYVNAQQEPAVQVQDPSAAQQPVADHLSAHHNVAHQDVASTNHDLSEASHTATFNINGHILMPSSSVAQPRPTRARPDNPPFTGLNYSRSHTATLPANAPASAPATAPPAKRRGYSISFIHFHYIVRNIYIFLGRPPQKQPEPPVLTAQKRLDMMDGRLAQEYCDLIGEVLDEEERTLSRERNSAFNTRTSINMRQGFDEPLHGHDHIAAMLDTMHLEHPLDARQQPRKKKTTPGKNLC